MEAGRVSQVMDPVLPRKGVLIQVRLDSIFYLDVAMVHKYVHVIVIILSHKTEVIDDVVFYSFIITFR